MKKFTNEEMKELLLAKFPEFRESTEFKEELGDEAGSYEYYARFADFILKEINKNKETDLAKRTFEFINDIYSSESISADVWDLFGIELLETFENDDNAKVLAEKYLKGKALEAYKNKVGRPIE